MKQVLFTLFTITTTHSFATNYYVSQAGSNSNNGLASTSAFRTINYAASQTAAGDTVFIMNGTYTNSNSASNVVDIYHSGTVVNRIVYINYPTHSPTIKMYSNNWGGYWNTRGRLYHN